MLSCAEQPRYSVELQRVQKPTEWTEQERARLVSQRLGEAERVGQMHPDLGAALWTLQRALSSGSGLAAAVAFGSDVMRSLDLSHRWPWDAVGVGVRAVSRAEHDALLGREATRGVDADEYQRLMREAQS